VSAVGSEEAVRAVRDRFDVRSATYDASAMHRDLAETVAAFVTAVPQDATVLDVATGTGLVLRALRDRHGIAPAGLVGVDVSPGMLGVARQTLPGATLVEADARSLPFADGSVALLTCVTGLHLIPDTDRVVAEWARVLRPGGAVVTATYAEFEPGRHNRETTAGQPAAYPMRHEPFRTPRALGDTVAGAGLVVRRHTTWTDGHDELLLAELGRAG
jgi:ubiquinone/menaquinone biosynthesis C-methylase UbiE